MGGRCKSLRDISPAVHTDSRIQLHSHCLTLIYTDEENFIPFRKIISPPKWGAANLNIYVRARCSLAYLTVQKLSQMFTLELRNPPHQEERPATVNLKDYFQANVLDKILAMNVNFWPFFKQLLPFRELHNHASLCCRQRSSSSKIISFHQLQLK